MPATGTWFMQTKGIEVATGQGSVGAALIELWV
jgi:hypothetical protein